MSLLCVFYEFIFYKFDLTKTYFIGNAYFEFFSPAFSVAYLYPVTWYKKELLKSDIVKLVLGYPAMKA